MSKKISDQRLERLRDWGADHVFAYPGDGIDGLLAAWDRADDDPRPSTATPCRTSHTCPPPARPTAGKPT
ncbi:hypothetical protein AB0E77_11620 [Streptomyces sp. NPDC032940]|uniref:hypothetical protein n=1 Tax=Streptomyces sp. NPDC032940 TaxID=3155366 RepID=UPI00341167DC